MPGDSTQFVPLTSAGRLYHLAARPQRRILSTWSARPLSSMQRRHHRLKPSTYSISVHISWRSGPDAGMTRLLRFFAGENSIHGSGTSRDVQKAEFRTAWPQQSPAAHL